jgi:hypothetical protein
VGEGADMAAGGVHQLAQCITCHAWNADLSMVAVCPNNNEVHIYQASPSPASAWECIHVLQKVSLHILLVLPSNGEQCIHFFFLEFFWKKAHKPTDN